MARLSMDSNADDDDDADNDDDDDSNSADGDQGPESQAAQQVATRSHARTHQHRLDLDSSAAAACPPGAAPAGHDETRAANTLAVGKSEHRSEAALRQRLAAMSDSISQLTTAAVQCLPPESPFRKHSEDLARSFQHFKLSVSMPNTPHPEAAAFFGDGDPLPDAHDNADNLDTADKDDTTFVYDTLPPRLQAQWSVWREHLESLPTTAALLQQTLEEARQKATEAAVSARRTGLNAAREALLARLRLRQEGDEKPVSGRCVRGELFSQFVHRVTRYSSEYGTMTYCARNLEGGPHIFPHYGDYSQAMVLRTYGPWWLSAPDAQPAINPNNRCKFRSILNPDDYPQPQDFVEIELADAVFVTQLGVYETYNPGALVRVLAYPDPDHEPREHHWKVIWEGLPDTSLPEASRLFSPPIRSPSWPTRLLRLEFDSRQLGYYAELDAVTVQGYGVAVEPAASASASSSVSDGSMQKSSVSATVQDDVSFLSTDGLRVPSPPLHRPASMNDLSASAPASKPSFHARRASVDIALLQDLEAVLAHVELKQFDIESHREQVLDVPVWSHLPDEVVVHVCKFLPFGDALSLAVTCKRFKTVVEELYGSFRDLDLQHAWESLSDPLLLELATTVPEIHQLSLAWCSDANITTTGVATLLGIQGLNLRTLRLGSCHLVSSEFLQTVATYCPHLEDLDVSMGSFGRAGFDSIATLSSLTRLNLFGTRPLIASLVAVARGCRKLRHLNLGHATTSELVADDAIVAFANCCPDLESIDLWRVRSLRNGALCQLLRQCSQLRSLDIGWCRSIDPTTPQFVAAISQCQRLEKLVLTAVRDTQPQLMQALALHCPELRQLDVLGSKHLTPQSIEELLESCSKLELLDVSFCREINQQHVDGWRERYPHVEIKKSRT
eukprot:TRINITY_DN10768_c0_g1_i2.p1 TRINITY_DN10768_c0_g1~~TRINITY_DN10768_c0_g1_i2.p1  ORF type:complete len:1035 (+),score=188.33 TRINITY_DN10768_c0_g1_i2:406-3105(+)